MCVCASGIFTYIYIYFCFFSFFFSSPKYYWEEREYVWGGFFFSQRFITNFPPFFHIFFSARTLPSPRPKTLLHSSRITRAHHNITTFLRSFFLLLPIVPSVSNTLIFAYFLRASRSPPDPPPPRRSHCASYQTHSVSCAENVSRPSVLLYKHEIT